MGTTAAPSITKAPPGIDAAIPGAPSSAPRRPLPDPPTAQFTYRPPEPVSVISSGMECQGFAPPNSLLCLSFDSFTSLHLLRTEFPVPLVRKQPPLESFKSFESVPAWVGQKGGVSLLEAVTFCVLAWLYPLAWRAFGSWKRPE